MLRTFAALFAALFLTQFVQAKEVNVSGSTSVARLMEVLAEQYNTAQSDTYIAVQGIGSTAGITLVKKGVSEIGMSSRYLTEAEQSSDLTVQPFAFDGLAVIVNHANDIADITREQLYQVYKGNISNWKQLGGSDKPIAVVTREASSGSRYSFESLLGLTKVINDKLVSDINPTNLVVNSNSMVKTIVTNNPHAIGFVSEGSVDRSVKALTFEGVSPNQQHIASGKYELSRPFILLFKTEKISEEGKNFVKYVHSAQAQSFIEQYGYINSNTK
jgi:phosphate transport system substrate-binding protein